MTSKSSDAQALTVRKTPRQRRSVATVATILEAAARILETEGASAYSTNAVAARAGVSIGSLYQYFPSKDAITRALIQENARVLLADLQAVEMEGDAIAEFKCLLNVAVKHQLERPVLARILDVEELRLPMDEAFKQTASEAMQVLLRVLTNTNMVAPAQQELVCGDLFAIVKGMVDAAGSRGEVDQAALSTRVHCAVFGYLEFFASMPMNAPQKSA